MPFKFFEEGNTFQIEKWIDDGKHEFVADTDALDLLRWESDGGAYNSVDKKLFYDILFDWKRYYREVGKYQRKERKRKNLNYQMFGVRI